MGKGRCKLKDKWLKVDKYKRWLRKASSPYYFHCTCCDADLSVENGVEDALKKHAKGQDHITNDTGTRGVSIMDFVTPQNDTSSSSSLSGAVIDNLADLDIQVQRAEIKYALRVVKGHSSFRSCVDLNNFLQDIFHDSPIVSKFTFGKTKCMYLIKFGIAPYVREKLTDRISTSPFFSASFDESHNSVLEMEQMDLQIRYWCPESNLAVTRYWGSQFQYRTTADALTEALIKGLPSSPTLLKMHQLAMDGPNVNWLVLSMISKTREDEEMPPLECIGSCGLHVVSGALQNGVKAAEWGTEKLLMGMYKFLHKAPGRRADYLKVSNNTLFPLKFCPTRWVENAMVAERGIEVWKGIVNLIKFILEKPPSKRPKDNKSFDNLVKYHLNPLVKVQLHLFKDIASILNGFLVKFQTDSPMIPFLSIEIGGILRRLMRLFIPKIILKDTKTPFQLQQIDVEQRENIVPASQIKLTTGAAAALTKVPTNLHDGLKKGFLKMLQVLIKKIQEKSPLKYKLVRNAACLSPLIMTSLDPEALQKMFDSIVGIMHKNKRITSKDGDKAKEQFDNFLANEVVTNQNDFKIFDFITTRLDEFLKMYTLNGKKYEQFWLVCIFIFTLSHGQSSVERGFNVNKETLKDNIETHTIESLRIVYDEILAQGNDIKSFEITKGLRLSCKSARRRYQEDMERKKESSEMSEKSRKRKLLNDELLTVKRKKVEEGDLLNTLRKDSDVFVKQASKEGVDPTEMKLLIVKAQSFKDIAKKKEEAISGLTYTIEKIEGELKSMK